MLKMIMEDMEPDEVAVMYVENGDAIVLIARHLSDDQRCEAVNRLLSRITVRVSPWAFPRPVPHAAQPEETEPGVPGSPTVLRLAR